MQVDITEAAQFYEIQRVPLVVYDPWTSEGLSAFSPADWKIYYGDFPRYMGNTNMEQYLTKRFVKTGAKIRDHADIVRFAFAHELWHTRQYETKKSWVLHEMHRIQRAYQAEQVAYISGHGSEISLAHDQSPLEVEADQQAVKAYKLVKVTDV